MLYCYDILVSILKQLYSPTPSKYNVTHTCHSLVSKELERKLALIIAQNKKKNILPRSSAKIHTMFGAPWRRKKRKLTYVCQACWYQILTLTRKNHVTFAHYMYPKWDYLSLCLSMPTEIAQLFSMCREPWCKFYENNLERNILASCFHNSLKLITYVHHAETFYLETNITSGKYLYTTIKWMHLFCPHLDITKIFLLQLWVYKCMLK